ncbi:phosphonate C-P lyase system protein PhnL [Aurantimonas sp. C2-6-R+9]|uniref:phosphonate C-P lyase system protein PhnL n=1 Tax=unclassified Aurantimonas TaxID=2638230 RepID=UPI002E16D53D|nr:MULTISPECIES: phosphonate C-P lyase system protein PhnL [unclassified Aurantimonas]MEC5292290.1 phosphonate C-P lyase system protein PhnL [Aurantimonas sp. C2-3-R2]MEC5382504.1 phosphonate C-P lyase system protein PhnL [Aurantimonas sp. C2-6-R+9]MEC5413375.1 phosphonate C-P lyase system protein PhnL [Aurantimonas sp. C2-4-R8]
MPGSSPSILSVRDVEKSFTMHLRGGVQLPVVRDAGFAVAAGECVVLGGPSGVGKSSILRMVYGNYSIDAGAILLSDPESGATVDLAAGDPRTVLEQRRSVVGYVSQFLRAIPRVPAIDVVAEPLVARGVAPGAAREKARALLSRLNLPDALFDLPPATFSGGEKQRVNIARGFITDHPLLLLDEPTASLDPKNRDVVCQMIEAKKAAGVAILGIFHDEVVRDRIATRIIDVSTFSARKVA